MKDHECLFKIEYYDDNGVSFICTSCNRIIFKKYESKSLDIKK